MIYAAKIGNKSCLSTVKPVSLPFVKRVWEFNVHPSYCYLLWNARVFTNKELDELCAFFSKYSEYSKDPCEVRYADVAAFAQKRIDEFKDLHSNSKGLIRDMHYRLLNSCADRPLPPDICKAKSLDEIFDSSNQMRGLKGVGMEDFLQDRWHLDPYLQPELRAELRSKGLDVCETVEEQLDRLFTLPVRRPRVLKLIATLGPEKGAEEALSDWDRSTHPFRFEPPSKVLASWKRLGFIE